MFKLSAFKKYFITTAVIFLVCLTFMVVILSFLINNYLSDDKFDTLSVSCDAVSNYVFDEFDSEYYKLNLFFMSRAMSQVAGNTMIVSDNSGKIISCSCGDFGIDNVCTHSVNRVPENILSNINYRYEEVTEFGGIFSDLQFVAGRKIIDKNGADIGYVFAASPASDLTNFYRDLFSLYVISAIIPIIILFVSLYLITYRWIKPLKLMSFAAKSMAKGDFSKRIPVNGHDEISQLAKSFNQMTDSLVELESMRRSFVANISHELKTPLTSIGGFIDGVVDGTIEREKHKYYLNIVSNEVKRMTRMVESMLNLSKLEAGEIEIKPSMFDFRDVLFDVAINLEQRIETKKLEIVGLDKIENCEIYADRDLLHQVIYNLCDNAVKFTDESGQIYFSLICDDSHFEFKIKNTGRGIPKKDLPKIFERFYKGDHARSEIKESSGLGLYLVKTIIKIHGGNAFVKSVENEFTEIGIRMPKKSFVVEDEK